MSKKVIAVASENPVKLNCVKEIALQLFDEVEIIANKVDSGVPDQPFNDETFLGAENRFNELRKKYSNSKVDYIVSIEGGIFETYGRYIAKGVVCAGTAEGKHYFGDSPGFELPVKVIEKIQIEKMELGHVIDELSGVDNSKQKGGAVGFLTNGIYTRTDLYKPAVLMAFIPLHNKKLFG